MIKKFLCCLFIACMVFLAFVGTTVYADTIEQCLEADMKAVYKKALAAYGSSNFIGYCGYCTGYQLRAAGVFNSIIAANGNYSYEKYRQSTPSSGVSVTAFPGKYKSGSYTIIDVCNLLNQSNSDGHKTYTAFCFRTGSKSEAGQKYGHVLLVHSVFNGKVYWVESWGANIRVATISSFASQYAENGNMYHFDGAVAFGYEGGY